MSSRKHLPPASGSPFGDFPPDYGVPAMKRQAAATKKSAPAKQQVESPSKHFLKGHHGNGGLCASTMKPVEKPKPVAPRAGAFRKRDIPPTEFRRFYERGDLPVSVQHRSNGRKIDWKVDVEKLDYHHYLPIFFDGLREKEEPFRFLAYQGCYDLLERGGAKVLPTIPQLIIPLKTALNTRDSEIVGVVLKVVQKLVASAELVGEALVPYYRQILPVLNLFRGRNANMGDAIEYGQRKRENIGDLVEETLTQLEIYGGEDAFINIKYMIPTYESAVLN